jgi:hypothetical protein
LAPPEPAEKIYTECKELNLPDVDKHRSLFDFLHAAASIAPEFASVWRISIQKKQAAGKETLDLYKLIELFRNDRRLADAHSQKGGSHSAFAASFQGKSLENSDSATTVTDKGKKPCLCGVQHRFRDCPYLIESIRPKDWKPDLTIQKQIDDKLRKRPNLRQTVNWSRKQATKKQDGQRAESSPADPEVQTRMSAGFPVHVFTASTKSDYHLRHSFLLDSAANGHICNKRERFVDLRPATEEDFLYSGNTIIPIDGFGTITIAVKTPTGIMDMKLLNVALIPSFHTSVVSEKKFEERNVYADKENRRLYFRNEQGKRQTLCYIEDHYEQYTLEYNEPIDTEYAEEPEDDAAFHARVKRSAAPRPDEKVSADTWHLRLGHPGPEAIKHLQESTIGAQLVGNPPTTIECEACSISKAKQIISRRPSPRGERPYERICWDLIQMTKAYNGDKWVSHMVCDRTAMNHVYTQSSKTQSLTTIQRFIRYVYRRYGCVVRIIRLDGETSLLTAFEEWAEGEGITIERVPPYVKEQNGGAERSGGVVMQKSRAIQIAAHLPDDLWPEPTKTAGYLLNRLPTRRLEWKTPLEKLYTDLKMLNPQPNIAHIRVYGCRAYPLIPNEKIPRTQKLAPRAHIGYLVGYESTNIFRVWVPSKKKVIKTRDVTFNEQLFYNPTEIDLASLLRREPEELVEVVEFPSDPTLLSEQLDLDSDLDSDIDEEILQTDLKTSSQTASKTIIATPESDSLSMLPTPDPTPEPDRQTADSASAQTDDFATQIQPHHRIVGDVSELNIVEGPRTRKRSDRRAAYFAELERPNELPAYRAAFSAGLMHGRDQRDRLHRDQLPPPPRTWKEMLTHPYQEGFSAAAAKEYGDLERRDTFRHVARASATSKVLPLKWVFIYKFDTDGYLTKFKARICVRGDLQEPNHHDTYAATLAAKTFRSLMAVAAAFDLEIFQFDAVNAFTNSAMEETVYCECPEGFQEAGKCLLLLRALYGLRTSPLLWFKEFSTTLKGFGLERIDEEVCLYQNEWLLVFFYVDDIAALCRKDDLPKFHRFKEDLMAKYEMKFIGNLHWFLGIRVLRDREQRKLWLCQDSYIEKITKSFNLHYNKPVPIPMSPEDYSTYTEKATPQQIHLYQRKVGSILYAAIITRPDAAKTASKLAEFLQNPSPRHHAAVDQAISYLYGTRTLAIEFSAEVADANIFACASDAAFADDQATRRSSEGYLFKLFGGAIDWHSTKQKTVTTSSTEAELLALTRAAKEIYWWNRFFGAIRLDPGHESAIDFVIIKVNLI